MSNTANKLVNLIRELTQEQLEFLDQTAFCQVQSVNADGTVNVYILPDIENVIYNIINESRFTLSERDICVLYKIGNKLNNAFVIAKCGVGNAGVVTSSGIRSSSGSGGGGSSGGAVTGVKGSAESSYRIGNVNISAENIGLGNVDNTADLDKPISRAAQAALDNKLNQVTSQQGQALYGVSGSTQVMIKAGANITIENNEISATGGGTSARVEDNILYI